MIKVACVDDNDPFVFEVSVGDGAETTRHTVTMSRRTFDQLGGNKHPPDYCIAAAFRFLLVREPKESILPRFDVTEISRYFPEFESELSRYL